MSLFDLVYKLYKLFPVSLRVKFRDVYFFLKYGTCDMFVTVDLELNSHCNLDCEYCPNHWQKSRGFNFMPWSLIKKLVSELKELDYCGNIHTSFYGEPLLDKRLVKIIDYISGELPKAFIRVFTNATLLTVAMFDKLSTYGVKEFVLTPHNESSKMNIERIFNYYDCSYGENNVSKLGVSVVVNELPYLLNRGGNVPLKGVVLTETCVSPSRYLTITYSGNVLLCCCDYKETSVMGNVNNERLIDVWHKPYYKKLRSDIKHGVYELELCKVCGRVSNDCNVEYVGGKQ